VSPPSRHRACDEDNGFATETGHTSWSVSWFSAATNFVTPEITWGCLSHESGVWSNENRRCLATRHAIARLMRIAEILNLQFAGEGRTYYQLSAWGERFFLTVSISELHVCSASCKNLQVLNSKLISLSRSVKLYVGIELLVQLGCCINVVCDKAIFCKCEVKVHLPNQNHTVVVVCS
jgi:hypothetical protein